MATPVFIWTPSWQTQEQSEPRTRLADLASAISMGSDGINTDLKNWNVVLENRLHDEALAIDFFLASRGGVEAFEWNNPRSLSKLYVCEQWDCVVIARRGGSNAVADRIWTITASFREVTEAGLGGTVRPPRTGGGAVAESLSCWYQRAADGFEREKVYGCVVDPNGDMYVAQYFGSDVLPAVYKISNDVTEVWGKQYSLDPALASGPFNSFGGSYFLLNSSSNSIDFLAWQWATAGPPYFRDYPVRIYRYRISKSDGSIINVAATDFNPTGNPSQLSIDIRDVKIDASNNYYFIGTLPINGENLTTCVFKFTENLAFVWCKAIPQTVYRGGGVCGVSVRDGNLFASLTIGDDDLIGCAGINAIVFAFSNYFRLDFNGNTLSSFLPKFRTPNFEDDTDPFIPRSVCRDAEGNIYGFGGYDSSAGLGSFYPIVVYKDSPSDATIWAKNIRETFRPGRGALVGMGNQLLIVDNKLVLVAPWELEGSFQLLVCIFNTSTGEIERSLDFRTPGGSRAIIQAMPESSKFIVQTDSGHRIRLNVNNLPPDGTYPFTDTVGAYTVTSASTVTTDHTFYRFTGCGSSSPALIDRNLNGMFTPVTPVSTIATATGGLFRHFACQDS